MATAKTKKKAITKPTTLELANELSQLANWLRGAEEDFKTFEYTDGLEMNVIDRGYANFNLWSLDRHMPERGKARLIKHFRRVAQDEIRYAKKRQEELLKILGE